MQAQKKKEKEARVIERKRERVRGTEIGRNIIEKHAKRERF